MTYYESIMDAGYTSSHQQLPSPIAPKYKRFINFFIDYFIAGTALGILIGAIAGLVLSLSGRQEWLQFYMDSALCKFGLTLVMIISYYTISEYCFCGKTIGKFLTRTRVDSCDGTPLTFGQILKRSCARFLPFETISVLFGYGGKGGWHDQISKTMVIRCASFFEG